jgi:ribosome-binding ATPase
MLSVGLVGLPNAGKSTLFNLLTERSVPAENFPFCTIDPNSGIVEVPDERIQRLGEMSKSQKQIYTAIEFTDIAGLVKGASTGAGLGNKFLSHIREVDLVLYVLRAFQDDDIIHVENRVDPQEDFDILLLELVLADQGSLEKQLPKFQKDSRGSGDKLAGEKLEIIEKMIQLLVSGAPVSQLVFDESTDKDLVKWRKTLNLLTDKPILKLANIKREGQNVDFVSDFKLDILEETELADLTTEERIELGVEGKTGLDTLIKACYRALNLATYLTTGEVESRAWTFRVGMKAPECAGVIHTDFEKKFIKAEVVSFEDLMECGSEKVAVEKGKLRQEGKEYLMKDGDVVEFKIGG